MAPPKLVVIGAGVAGARVAQQSTKNGFDVTVIDPKDFFDIKFASLRAAVVPAVADTINFKYTQIPGLGKFKQAYAKNITDKTVELDSGETLEFDYLVLATGSSNAAGPYAQPQGTTLESRKAEYKQTFEEVQGAKNIVIVGGGPLGVELAAEIVEAFAGKNVTMVHSGKRLFDTKPEKVGKNATEWLKAHGVKVEYGVKAEKGEGHAVTLSSGTTLPSDLTIWTIGSKPNTEWLKSTILASSLDAAGRVKVESSFRVVGHANIFALGDITDVKEDKLGYLAAMHAEIAVKNLQALKKSGTNATMTAWKPGNGTDALFVTLGKSAGAGFLGGCVCPSCLVSGMKSKDLFVGKVKGDLGVK